MGSREKAVQEGEEQYGQKYGRETVDDAVLRDSGLASSCLLNRTGKWLWQERKMTDLLAKGSRYYRVDKEKT